MRIRTQLLAFVSASVCTGLLAAVIVFAAGRREDAAGDAQARAQTTEHEVAGLLALTQEYARYAEPRAAAGAGDRRAGGDVRAVGDAQRRGQHRVAADERVRADLGVALGDAVVVG